MRSSAATARRGKRCFVDQYSFQGSARNRPGRNGTVAIVNCAGDGTRASSVHATGTDTGASGLARVEYAAIDVVVRLLRR
jgi:hypothetical protein